MKILFLTLARIDSVEQKGIYQDLIRKIRDKGNEIIIVTPNERKFGNYSTIIREGNATILKVWTPNIQKANIFEKSVGTIIIEYLYKKAIYKYFNNLSVDLILYSTPPITFNRLITELKKKTNAQTYLLLKDIFPQNAIDLKLVSKKGLIYRYFKKREEILYRISDRIGCMSSANVDYVLKNNSWLASEKVEVNPNSIEILDSPILSNAESPYSHLFEGKVVFVYGGNLGKPQGIDFLLEVIVGCEDLKNVFFLIVGSGTEGGKISKWIKIQSPPNAMMLDELPRHEYDSILQQCHVGLIFIHRDFTIPNYPSRLLPYMECKMPVLCATDKITDIGSDAVENEYGYWCQSGDLKKFKEYVSLLANDNKLRNRLGKNAYKYLKSKFNVDVSYKIIFDHFKYRD
jgi:glycosyltransferase involved in cell wall biosynthesis